MWAFPSYEMPSDWVRMRWHFVVLSWLLPPPSCVALVTNLALSLSSPSSVYHTRHHTTHHKPHNPTFSISLFQT